MLYILPTTVLQVEAYLYYETINNKKKKLFYPLQMVQDFFVLALWFYQTVTST